MTPEQTVAAVRECERKILEYIDSQPDLKPDYVCSPFDVRRQMSAQEALSHALYSCPETLRIVREEEDTEQARCRLCWIQCTMTVYGLASINEMRRMNNPDAKDK